MDRRAFILGGVAAGAAPLAAGAQQAGKVWRVGHLGVSESRPRVFVETLRELGYVEGRNLIIEWRHGAERSERYADAAAEFVRLRVDAIVTIGMIAVRAARHATSSIPIIMAVSEDPVGAGLAASLARPGGNVTGFTRDVGHDVMTKTLQLLREAIPVSRVGLMVHESNRGIEQLQTSALSLGIALRRLPIGTPEDIPRIYASLSRESLDALYVLGNVLAQTHRQLIIELSAAHRIPTMYWWRQPVLEGGLMAYGIDFNEPLRGAAHYLHRIFRGASPATLPIQQPTKFELVINLKTAKALGLTIPPSLLARADQVIE